jgi:D-amino-acid dehydrogenase
MAHVIIVGAGVVGLSCALAAQRSGWDVTLIDRDFEGDRASHGNAGGIAVSECVPLSLAGLGIKPLKWLLDPLGPLAIRPLHAPKLLPWYMALRKVAKPRNFARIGDALAALNRTALEDFEAMLAEIGLSGDIHKRGALTVYETDRAFHDDQNAWQFKRDRGVRWHSVSQAELRELEPGLAPVFKHAVMLQDWAHIKDPKRVVETLRAHVVSQGATLIAGEAVGLSVTSPDMTGVILNGGKEINADRVVVAAGAWSARLASTIGDRALIESERGYNTTLPKSAEMLRREVIFAERMFVATPLEIGLRIGGAAEFAGLEAPANYQRSDALLRLARRYLPGLDESTPQKWMGNRPTTPDSLPVIGPSGHSNRVLYAFGHGHLGLTQSATTAKLIADMLGDRAPATDLRPYAITRF